MAELRNQKIFATNRDHGNSRRTQQLGQKGESKIENHHGSSRTRN